MAEKRQKKQAVKAFEKETFSKDKEVTGAKHTEHRQDNTFPTENHFHANEKPVSNLPRDANHGSDTKNVTSGHNVQKSETGAERKTGNSRENTHTESVRSQKIQSSPIMEISRQRMPHFRRDRRKNLPTKKYRRLLISRKRVVRSYRKQRTRCRKSGSMR